MAVSRIGILTGGGDCPGLNAVIRAVVKRARVEFGWEVLGIEDGWAGLMYPDRVHRLDTDAVSGILPRGGTILGTSNRHDPFRDPEGRDVSEATFLRARELGLDAVVVVGGDGTQKIGMRLTERYGLRTASIPKTIDNDVNATDLTFGFDSARACATDALDRLHSTAESHDRALVLEVMGRDSGFIALHAGLAGGADVILIPEIPYDIAEVCRAIEERRSRGRTFSLVIVAEGAAPSGGEAVYQAPAKGGHLARLGGIGHHVAAQIEAQIGMEARVTVLGYLQRGGTPTPFDRILGTRFGVAVLDLIDRGRFGRMVALDGDRIVDVELEEAVGHLRRVDPEGEMVRAARSLGLSFG